MSNDELTATETLIVVEQNFTLWTGTVALEESDHIYRKILPGGLMQKGRKSIFPKTGINPLETIKQRSRRYLESVAMPILGKWAIPQSKEAAVFLRLQNFDSEWTQALDHLARTYDQQFERWVSDTVRPKDPLWAKQVIDCKLPVDDVIARFHCELYSMSIIPSGTAAHNTATLLDGMGGRLLQEVQRFANSVCDSQGLYTATTDHQGITLRTRVGHLELLDKVRSFRFLGNDLATVEMFLAQMTPLLMKGQKGRIRGLNFWKLKAAFIGLSTDAGMAAIVNFQATPDSLYQPETIAANVDVDAVFSERFRSLDKDADDPLTAENDAGTNTSTSPYIADLFATAFAPH